jgi:hypothetical protein
MKKISVLILSMFAIIGCCVLASAETITDPSGDVAHWNYSQTTWGWSYNIGNKPDVDITELKQRISDGKMIIEMVVVGTIQTSELYSYSAWFNTSDAYYWFYWSNGEGGGIAANTIGGFNFSQANVEVSGNILTATFDIIGEDNTAEFFWGYAWQYTNIGDVATAEWWGDWTPNEESPFFGEDIDDTEDTEDSDDTSDNEDTGDMDDSDENNNEKSTDTPGFALFSMFISLIVFIFIIKRRR